MTKTLIQLDGSLGEGGGQILRSALAMSLATGRGFRIRNVRANRDKPGLMRQHLTCVTSCAELCGATVDGAFVGSREVAFEPGAVKPGTYHWAIGTAGSVTMVLQAVLPALLRASAPSSVTIEGGTHLTMAPPFDFFARALVPMLELAGAKVVARIDRHGFYPAGGGRIAVDIEPSASPRRVEIMERGEKVGVRAKALVSRLPKSIAQRELDVVRAKLELNEDSAFVMEDNSAFGPGNAVMIDMQYANVTEVVTALGQLGVSAERVAHNAIKQAQLYEWRGAAVGEHLADQLMTPLAVMAGGAYRTGPLSSHATTNIATLEAFGVGIRTREVEADGGASSRGHVVVEVDAIG
jgi:RNA 3'-terminal phosphate cyclase (ATP)